MTSPKGAKARRKRAKGMAVPKEVREARRAALVKKAQEKEEKK